MVRSITGSPWTPEDRALLIALEKHEARFCDKCGQPKDTAWHPDNDGYFEVTAEVTCWGCTTLQNHGAPADSQHPVQYLTVTDTRDYQASPLPPVQLAPVAGSTPAAATTAPTDAPLGG